MSTIITIPATGSGGAIGSDVTSGTAGSVLFVGSGAVLSQDNANFFWDDTNDRLGIGVNSTLSAKLHVVSGASSERGLIVKAASSQSVNLAEWQTSAAAVRARITSTGSFSNASVGGTGCEIFGDSAAVGSGLSGCTAIGNSANAGIGGFNTCIGSSAIVDSSSASNANYVLIGANSAGGSSGGTNGGVAIGVGSSAAGSTTIGWLSASANGSVAVGISATATGSNSIAIGTNTNTGSNNNVVAVGSTLSISSGPCVAIGNYLTVGPVGFMALGVNLTASHIDSVILGRSDGSAYGTTQSGQLMYVTSNSEVYFEQVMRTSVQTRPAARMQVTFVSSTDASYKTRVALSACDATTFREAIRYESDGSVAKLGFYGVSAVTRPGSYTPTNVSTDRSYDADATTTAELADVLGTLIADLQSLGLIS